MHTVTTEPAARPAPQYGAGDTVSWQASRMRDVGTGIVVWVLPPVHGGRLRGPRPPVEALLLPAPRSAADARSLHASPLRRRGSAHPPAHNPLPVPARFARLRGTDSIHVHPHSRRG